MENILEIGGKKFEVKANFKLSYNLTKYRNKISTGFDFSNADKEVVQEILDVLNSAEREEDIDLSKLSPEALKLLAERNNKDMFSYAEILDIMRNLTSLTDDNEIISLLDKEVEENGYDSITTKLIKAISLVFTSAKGTSAEKETKVAEK